MRRVRFHASKHLICIVSKDFRKLSKESVAIWSSCLVEEKGSQLATDCTVDSDGRPLRVSDSVGDFQRRTLVDGC